MLVTSHFKVPAPDGDFGHRGHCFPKHISALISAGINNNISPKMHIATNEKNKEVRSNKNWKKYER